jgi:hypothetical protein
MAGPRGNRAEGSAAHDKIEREIVIAASPHRVLVWAAITAPPIWLGVGDPPGFNLQGFTLVLAGPRRARARRCGPPWNAAAGSTMTSAGVDPVRNGVEIHPRRWLPADGGTPGTRAINACGIWRNRAARVILIAADLKQNTGADPRPCFVVLADRCANRQRDVVVSASPVRT